MHKLVYSVNPLRNNVENDQIYGRKFYIIKYIKINKKSKETKNSKITISKSLYLITILMKIKIIKQKSMF